MKISIIGLGFVGLSFAAVLGSKNYSVLGIDNDPHKIMKIDHPLKKDYQLNYQSLIGQENTVFYRGRITNKNQRSPFLKAILN